MGLESEPRETIQRKAVPKITATDHDHPYQCTPPVQNAITSFSEPLATSRTEKSSSFCESKLEMEMDNGGSESKTKLKRVHKTCGDEGFAAEENRPRVKRLKKKSNRSEQIAEATVEEDLDKRRKQGVLEVVGKKLSPIEISCKK